MPDTTKIIAENNLELFIKEIFVLENEGDSKKSSLTFFADGYPGVIYQQSENAFILPQKKELTSFFLYGQMIDPFELLMTGPYLMIVFQLYPFASKLFFDVDPKKLNDDCYDLSQIEKKGIENPLEDLNNSNKKEDQVEIVATFLSKIASEKGMEEYVEIQRAIQIIVDHKGVLAINDLARHLNISERTLHRKFNYYVGISPKKFAKIIQFQSSVAQISKGTFSKLTDVVYENGYADQSHFIRNIKNFTGKRPSQLKNFQ